MAEITAQLLANAEADFTKRNPKSQAIYDEATKVLPGGNTRTVLFYTPFPVSVVRAEGSRLYDADGHEYIDLLGEYTAGLYGHSDPVITEAVIAAVRRGLSFGGQHADEGRLAALIQERFPSIDLVRFTNSGTEATLMALAVAKAHTGRSKILVFAGAYHGGAFSFPGFTSSAVNAPHEYLIARYNDLTSVEELLEKGTNAVDLAAIIVEPMTGSGGAIPADREFLLGLRDVATRNGAVLIFDEVMTSRMYAGGGIQSQLPADQRPDMTTLGKYIGGGMSFGAFGGRREIMSHFDPRRPDALAHAGTFNNNVLSLSAGIAGLELVFTPARAQELHDRGEELQTDLQEVAKGTRLRVTGLGSIMCFHFTNKSMAEIRSATDLMDADKSLAAILHLFLLEKGYYIARRGFLALSLAVSEIELKGFVDAVRDFVTRHRHLIEVQS